ncbi:hypothetical protein PV797_19465 [Clostridiaceae bacterium M8S5]|nr:hypothetical protein PV797_19465 [Clostridiaceae bacterium M8S5]
MKPNQTFEVQFKVNKEPEKKLKWEFKNLKNKDVRLKVYQGNICIHETMEVKSELLIKEDNTNVKLIIISLSAVEKKVDYRITYEYLGGVNANRAIKTLKLIKQ